MKRFSALILCVMFLFTGCTEVDVQYYADRSNYVTVTGTVSHIQYDDDVTALYIGIEECPEGFSDTAFKLVGDGLSAAQKNGIDDALQLGSEITLIAAPRYFGDGYVVPLAAIEVDGAWFLEFDEGYTALMNWLK